MSFKGIADFFTRNKYDFDGLGDGKSTFDPNYGQFYDDGGWTETIIGPDMSEEIYRGTIGDSRWNKDISGGIANVDEWIKMIEDKSKENQFLDNQKVTTGISNPSSQQAAFQQISPSVTLTRDGVPFSPYGSAAKYASLGAGLQGGLRMAGQGLGITDIAKMGMQGLGSALTSKALYAINPVLGAVNQFYPGGAPEAFKDVTRFAGGIGNTISKGIGGVVKGIGDFFCDERLKVDIAPLESTEVNDELAQMAFFVKGLRECS